MSSEIPFGEAWLLETAVRWNTRMYSQFLNDGHGLSRADLCDTLDRLFIGGEIVARIHDESGEVATEFVPKVHEIAEILDDPGLHVCYGLTPKGGQRWECFANPNWERYSFEESLDGDTCQLTGGSHDQLCLVLANAELLWSHDPISETIQWSEVSPWQATAWKTLPVGIRATYRIRMCNLPVSPDINGLKSVIAIRNWANSICGYRWV